MVVLKVSFERGRNEDDCIFRRGGYHRANVGIGMWAKFEVVGW